VLGVTALDVLCAQQLSRAPEETSPTGAIRVERSMVVDSTPEALYTLWRDFEGLPRFMKHLESVRVTGPRRSHWVAKGPGGSTAEWDAEVTDDRPNESIGWRSVEGSEVDTVGSVRFEPAIGDRGTIVRVNLEYNPPGGVIGAAVAWLFGEEPRQQVEADLRRFKQLVEAGEVVLSEGSLFGTGYGDQRPAQPPSADEARQMGEEAK
jgi:uncharacterized membrane protein